MNSGRFNLFFKFYDDDVLKYLEDAVNENVYDAIAIVFYILDKHGMNEKEIGRKCLEFLCSYIGSAPFMPSVLNQIHKYGQWDDVIYLYPVMRRKIFKRLINRLYLDVGLKNDNMPISSLVDWMPNNDDFINDFLQFSKDYKITNREEYNDLILELKNYDKRIKEEYKNDDLHNLIATYKDSILIDEEKEARYNELVNKMKNTGYFNNSIVVCDVSPSMEDYDAAVGLSALISEAAAPPCKNNLMTFSFTPKFVEISNSSLFEKIKLIKRMTGDCINFENMFIVLLEFCIYYKLLPKDAPNRIFIFTDKHFDMLCKNELDFNLIKKKYNKFGYKVPEIVFCNFDNSYGDIPVQINEGVILISGYNDCVLNSLLDGVILMPQDILTKKLSEKRYAEIKRILIEVNNFEPMFIYN